MLPWKLFDKVKVFKQQLAELQQAHVVTETILEKTHTALAESKDRVQHIRKQLHLEHQKIDQLTCMLNSALKDQIEVYCHLGVEKQIPLKSHLKSKSHHLELLKKLSAHHSTHLQGESVAHASAKSPSPFLHLNDLFILLVLLSRKKKALMSLILLVPLSTDMVQTNVAITM
jgi:hypothetical protein